MITLDINGTIINISEELIKSLLTQIERQNCSIFLEFLCYNPHLISYLPIDKILCNYKSFDVLSTIPIKDIIDYVSMNDKEDDTNINNEK